MLDTSDPVRLPHHPVRSGPGLLPQRQAAQAQGHLQSPGPRRRGRGRAGFALGFRIRRLKEMGSNAYRCAHNPPARRIAGRLRPAGHAGDGREPQFQRSPEYMRQLEWMVRRDRNHPSVILWSVFNEEPMQGTEAGYEMVRRMAAVVKALDTTRPVTAAMSGGLARRERLPGRRRGRLQLPAGAVRPLPQEHPNSPMTSSEDTSAFMTRGVYETDARLPLPTPTTTPRAVGRDAPRGMAGDRQAPVRRGRLRLDRLRLPRRAARSPGPASVRSSASWTCAASPRRPTICTRPRGSRTGPCSTRAALELAGSEGKPIRVMVLTNAETVELFLNGKSLGEKTIDRLPEASGRSITSPAGSKPSRKKGGRE